MNLDTSEPVIVAFAGNAGAGKTSTANMIVPKGSIMADRPEMLWDHTFFAKPIYDMITAKTRIEGSDAEDRILYGLHDVVYDLLQRRCSYEDLIELVYDLYHIPCEFQADEDKPRLFMQTSGDYCRALYVDCFADYAIKDITSRFHYIAQEYENNEEDPPLSFSIISDLRMRNEFDIVRRQPNNIIIKFAAGEDELDRRLFERSGRSLAPQEKKHISEAELASISDEEFDIIVDTTTLTLQDQASMVREAIINIAKNKIAV